MTNLHEEARFLAEDIRRGTELERELFLVRARIESRACLIFNMTSPVERIADTPLADAVTREHPRLIEPGRYYGT